MPRINRYIAQLINKVAHATTSAVNEAQLRHEIEKYLEEICANLSIPWTPFQLDRSLGTGGKAPKFVDVAHGAVVIEYEPPASFGGIVGAKLKHARNQAEEYALLLSREEGRSITEYVLVAWDGSHINFGRCDGTSSAWESLLPFDSVSAERLVTELQQNGTPLVHPKLLSNLAGPESEYGSQLIPAFYASIVTAFADSGTTKTKLLFAEWRRLFGQVVGVQSKTLIELLRTQGIAHGVQYQDDPSAYLFALNTYVALLAKLVAACALPNASQNILDGSVPIGERLRALESGELFEHAGILNMLSGDFFSWYADDVELSKFSTYIEALVARLSGINFDVTNKTADSTRDLFKGIYQTFVPRALRHALGEFYTPDWLAEHALDTIGWQPDNDLLDPTCGSGTFLLEALRRRLNAGGQVSAHTLMQGIYGIDLNPLAVLTAKGSLAVFIAPYLDPAQPVRIPVYLADAVNPSQKSPEGMYCHIIQTELGTSTFTVPEALILSNEFFKVFSYVRALIDADLDANSIINAVKTRYGSIQMENNEWDAFYATIDALCDLHNRGWNGIWCPIVADRFAAGAIPKVGFICGNPPWVKWSHLPPEYSEFIKPMCLSLGVFSSDRWVGGIEADISTIITYKTIDTYLAHNGLLGFFITGTVFTNESSGGFRTFVIKEGELECAVLRVEDYSEIKPFDGVSNHPVFMVVQRDKKMSFPIDYVQWSSVKVGRKKVRHFDDASQFLRTVSANNLLAQPVPGGIERPWIICSREQQNAVKKVFSSGQVHYSARKGVTTDRNGIYWVKLLALHGTNQVTIQNAADIGRTEGIVARKGIIETDHLFPLLRGRNVTRFIAESDNDLHILVPQRGMHGDPNLATTSPLTFKFFMKFQRELKNRSSYRRYQAKQGAPFYSLWSTGSYTFSPFKVLWREMSGGGFAVAYVGSVDDPLLGQKVVVPDHKLYFIPVDTEDEAAFLTGFLNAPIVAESISAYAASLSLGVSVAEYVAIPSFDQSNPDHLQLSHVSQAITHRRNGATHDELKSLDQLVRRMLGL